uniref:Uncharacterized protein n=1 Tax=Oryza punctata TaxID=4537 RepID=A0A0E0L4H4_ORYPU
MEGRREQPTGGPRRDRLLGEGEPPQRRGRLRPRDLPGRLGGGRLGGPCHVAVEGAGAAGDHGGGPEERGALPDHALVAAHDHSCQVGFFCSFDTISGRIGVFGCCVVLAAKWLVGHTVRVMYHTGTLYQLILTPLPPGVCFVLPGVLHQMELVGVISHVLMCL